MPELLQVKTADFELTVWASDISSRLMMYQRTLNRLPVADKHSAAELRLSAGGAEIWSMGQKVAGGDVEALSLPQPVFFENTEYQFEWIFNGQVEQAGLTHRSHRLNSAFRFIPAREPMPARLTGSIQTGNDVGWLRLPLRYRLNDISCEHDVAFEVLPTKMLLQRDLPVMYRMIDSHFPLWRFSLMMKTEQSAASSRHRGNFPLLWLAQFSRLREQFSLALDIIRQAPHSRLQTVVSHTRSDRLKGRIPHRLGTRVREDLARGQQHKRYRVEKKKLGVDTPENRFIRMVVLKSRQQLATFEQRLRASNRLPDRQRLSEAFLQELHDWQAPMQKMLEQSFLKDVGEYAGLSRESLVLQQKTGYSSIYRIWQELRFYLDALAGQSQVSMKSVAEIYEVWCFLRIRQILLDDLEFVEVASGKPSLVLRDFEYQLEDGLSGCFEFKRNDGVVARLAHEPVFRRNGKSIRSFLVAQKPDIVLEVTIPDGSGDADRNFLWLFDAKYRIETERSRLGQEDLGDIDGIDFAPSDAINEMHRYRDALIHLDGGQVVDGDERLKSRPVFGAFTLYPGCFEQLNESNPYAEAIKEVGIGGFALLPHEDPASGSHWLRQFLLEQIGVCSHYPERVADRLYVQDAARIPYHGMQQARYPDLTMTVALGGAGRRCKEYLDAFRQGTARWYHIPAATFARQYKQHVVNEIRYLALARTSDDQPATKQIDRVWPVLGVTRKRRHELTIEQAGKRSDSEEEFYLFELGRPLTLPRTVRKVPHRPVVNTMKLTTLSLLEKQEVFSLLGTVYPEAMSAVSR